MAGTDPKKQLLTLIRDFTSEKYQGERRVVDLKKRIEELALEIKAANAEREEAKRLKETTEQELTGYEVELALNYNAIQALESRISLMQDDISTVRTEMEAIKQEEGSLRDEFINRMFELNAKIRTFQRTSGCNFQKENSSGTTAEVDHNISNKEGPEVALKPLEDMLAEIVSQTAKKEVEYLEEENIQKQVQLELVDLERKVSLREMIMTETNALQELTKQTSEMEQTCASLTEELQKKCICPSCNKQNSDVLGGMLHANNAE